MKNGNAQRVSADPARYSAAAEDYLKAIHTFEEREGGEITITRLVSRLGLSASSVSGMVRKLCELELLAHRKYGPITLTGTGRTIALGVLRRHRLIELFLVTQLGYTWDEVHEEAEVLEHVVSDQMLDRIAERLGDPTVDPHGAPIPTSDGRLEHQQVRRLSSVEPGTLCELVRVEDYDPAMLRHLSSVGIRLGVSLQVTDRIPYGGSYLVRVGGAADAQPSQLGPALVAAMWVRSDELRARTSP
jgi:DtxR family Mn-dependent transcriptional regulator